MLPTSITTQLLTNQIDVMRVPSGSGIDFLVWPIMIAAFFYIVYLTTRKEPSDKGNKDNKK
jgi:ABC-type transporter Mla maintaining outer membrane lipid asymmetry permease subunit MlaE